MPFTEFSQRMQQLHQPLTNYKNTGFLKELRRFGFR
jgi:hypothetical protein